VTKINYDYDSQTITRPWIITKYDTQYSLTPSLKLWTISNNHSNMEHHHKIRYFVLTYSFLESFRFSTVGRYRLTRMMLFNVPLSFSIGLVSFVTVQTRKRNVPFQYWNRQLWNLPEHSHLRTDKQLFVIRMISTYNLKLNKNIYSKALQKRN